MIISKSENLKKIPLPATKKWPEGVWDVEAFRHGTMSLILYTPTGKDYQTPHNQDELYIVIEGAGTVNIEGKDYSFSVGDSIFVAAEKVHRFVDFSKDLKMWAVFWGEIGGEK
jgi:mannose-6-phosphate isomerase-like protein (cupin superfamily)